MPNDTSTAKGLLMPSSITLSAPSVHQVAVVLSELGLGGGTYGVIYVDQMTISEEAGLPLRSVQRALKVLGDEGVVEAQRGRYRILDAQKLANVASGVGIGARGYAKQVSRKGGVTSGASRARMGDGSGGGLSGVSEELLERLRLDHEALKREVVSLRGVVEALKAQLEGQAGQEARVHAVLAPTMMTIANADDVVAPIVAALELLRVESSHLRHTTQSPAQPKASPAAKVAAKPPQKTLFAWSDAGDNPVAEGKADAGAVSASASLLGVDMSPVAVDVSPVAVDAAHRQEEDM